jgi:antitoxin HicB
MNSRGYRLQLIEEEDGSWTVEVPDLPGAVAAGRTASEAVRRLPSAIDSWILGATEAGMPIPTPSADRQAYSGRFVLRVAHTLHKRLARRAEEEGVSLNTYCSNLLSAGIRWDTSLVSDEPRPRVASHDPRHPSDLFWYTRAASAVLDVKTLHEEPGTYTVIVSSAPNALLSGMSLVPRALSGSSRRAQA